MRWPLGRKERITPKAAEFARAYDNLNRFPAFAERFGAALGVFIKSSELVSVVEQLQGPEGVRRAIESIPSPHVF